MVTPATAKTSTASDADAGLSAARVCCGGRGGCPWLRSAVIEAAATAMATAATTQRRVPDALSAVAVAIILPAPAAPGNDSGRMATSGDEPLVEQVMQI